VPLTDALTAVFEKQFDCINEHGEACPGEVSCGETEGKPLFKYDSGDVESVCGGCKLKGSKPENIDERLRPFVASGFELAELKAAGARFDYPDGLMPFEWLSLTMLQRGKAKADATKRKKDEPKKKR